MTKRTYTTANGKKINIDTIIAQNENTIAVGNMKVNARGDQLGPGGVIETPKSKLMADYYKLNTPLAVDEPLVPNRRQINKDLLDDWIEPSYNPNQQSINESPAEETNLKLRGNLADSISKGKPQEKESPKKTGPSRI